ncbi:cytochrome P450 [Streptomyces natalensis]|uniref:cytochrome P450 n=1 Tax=Streptomyces natalensis TaxID=68242 RepID=UPI000AE4BCC7|nr:cytochrome P450 [Streptomyces natalensis]
MSTLNGIPHAPGAWPLLGHGPALFRDPLGFISSSRAHGDLVQIRLGPHPVVMVCDPDITQQVLRDDRTFDKGGPAIERGMELLGNGLTTCPHSEHRRQRRLCQPSFCPERLSDYAAVMSAEAETTATSWCDGRVIDVNREVTGLAAQALVQTMFSTALPSSTRYRTTSDLATVLEGIFSRMVLPPQLTRLPTPGNRRYGQACSRIRSTIRNIIAERRTAATDSRDLLSTLLGAVDTDSQGGDGALTDAEVVDQVVTFFLAGTDTTANTISWALHLLSQYPRFQERLHTEVDHVLAGSPPAYAHLEDLEFTRRVITETLRLYPPAWRAWAWATWPGRVRARVS